MTTATGIDGIKSHLVQVQHEESLATVSCLAVSAVLCVHSAGLPYHEAIINGC